MMFILICIKSTEVAFQITLFISMVYLILFEAVLCLTVLGDFRDIALGRKSCVEKFITTVT